MEKLIELLRSKNTKAAYEALKELTKMSVETNDVYRYMDEFIKMINDDNSYIRTRGLTLIVYNAKWDIDYKIDESIDHILKHITDDKPITSRQFIKILPMLAKDKPDLKSDIIKALESVNHCIYRDSMQPLIDKDIRKALYEIGGECNE